MSMGGGKGGGGSTSGQDMLAGTISELSSETKPIRDVLSSQFLEALNTGGIQARIPLVNAMQEQSRMAQDKALTGASGQLATAGLARTPFAASTLGNMRYTGERNTAMIPSQVAQGFIGGAPQFAMAPVGAMVGGASSLFNTQTNRDIAKGSQESQILTGLMQAAATATAAYVASGGCWIARRLYGPASCEAALARYWIMYAWRGRTANAVRWLYRRYGERVSRQPWVGVLRPLFDLAVTRGARA